MRIGINGRFLAAKRTGVQRAAYNLVKTILKIDRENEYFIFTSREQLDNQDFKYPNVKIIASDLQEGRNFRNHLWEQFRLPRLAKEMDVDILHSPANIAPLLYNGASIINVHDLCFVVNPNWYRFTFRTLYRLLIPRLAKRADKIITNSNNSKNDLLQFCKISSDKVNLVYWAVDDLFLDQKEDDFNLNIQDKYILYVGSLEPRKNIGNLLAAYEHMRKNHPELTHKLVLIGGESPLFKEVQLKVRSYKDDVIFMGFVSDIILKQYYRRADLLVYPSLYEGFGLPPLEAMASGTPVVTSTTSSIPEVVGQAAIKVSPHDVTGISQAISQVLLDPQLRKSLREKGQERVHCFNWYRVARHTINIYYEVYQKRKKGQSLDNGMSFETWKKWVTLEHEQYPFKLFEKEEHVKI